MGSLGKFIIDTRKQNSEPKGTRLALDSSYIAGPASLIASSITNGPSLLADPWLVTKLMQSPFPLVHSSPLSVFSRDGLNSPLV